MNIWRLVLFVSLASGSVPLAAEQNTSGSHPCRLAHTLAVDGCASDLDADGPWRVDFGAARAAAALRLLQPPGGQMVAGHRPDGGDLLRVLTPLTSESAPIDCAMARPADTRLDPRIVHRPSTGVTFAGVIRPVAPCPVKK